MPKAHIKHHILTFKRAANPKGIAIRIFNDHLSHTPRAVLWLFLDNGRDDRILKDSAPAIAVGELGDSSVNINVRPWTKTIDYWAAYSDTLEKIKVTFDENNISIPYPQTDLHLYKKN